MSWGEVGCADGLRLLVVGLWWLGCWGGGHLRGWCGFWLRFVSWGFFILFYFILFYFGGWGLRLWLVVVVVAMAVVRGDEFEKLRPWRF